MARALWLVVGQPVVHDVARPRRLGPRPPRLTHGVVRRDVPDVVVVGVVGHVVPARHQHASPCYRASAPVRRDCWARLRSSRDARTDTAVPAAPLPRCSPVPSACCSLQFVRKRFSELLSLVFGGADGVVAPDATITAEEFDVFAVILRGGVSVVSQVWRVPSARRASRSGP